MKTRQPEGQASGEATKHTLCWNKDPQAQALRIEIADGSFLVLPYDHLGFVKFEPHNDGDLVHVFLSTHDIEIKGMNLRELGLAFQKCAVDWVRALPARSSPRADDDYVWIKSITVHEAQD
jgi:hypothetical protein